MGEVQLQEKQFELLLAQLTRLADEMEQMRRKLDALDALDPALQEMARVGRALEALAFAVVGREGPQIRRRGA